MREIQHNETFSGSNETRNLAIITNSATVELQLECGGSYEVMETYTKNDVVEIDLNRGMQWRLSMSDSGASAKAYLSNAR